MREKLKIRKVGNSPGLILPQPILKSLNLKEGDELFVIKLTNGMMLTSHGPEFGDALEDAEAFMNTHRHVFERLAE